MSSDTERSSALWATGLAKRFGDQLALGGVDLEIATGEVVALLGENGSGKSTLVKILAGFHVPEPGGQLRVGGVPVPLPVPSGTYREVGLSFVFQDLGLAPGLRVVENLFVGERLAHAGGGLRPISWTAEVRRARGVLEGYEVDLDPRAMVSELRPTAQALLAIVRAAEELEHFRSRSDAARPGVLVLDEPTVFLPEHEKIFLFDLVARVTRSGTGVLFVSHDMTAVRQVAHRAVILRDGRLVGNVVVADVTDEALVERISGHRRLAPRAGAASQAGAGAASAAGGRVPLVALEGISGDGGAEGKGPPVSGSEGIVPRGSRALHAPGKDQVAGAASEPSDGLVGAGSDVALRTTALSGEHLHDIELTLYQGEILGVAGLLGSGSDELPYAIFGNLPGARGRIEVGHRQVDAARLTPRRARQLGMALVPADRKQQGAALSLSVQKNMLSLVTGEYFRGGFLRHGRMRSTAAERCARFGVVPADPDADMVTLSGGNQQKVVLAKWIEQLPVVLLLHEPTQGVDVATRAEIYDLMRALRSQGLGILWVSTDFDELATVCDRVVVCAGGRLVGDVAGPPFTRDEITSQVYGAAATYRRGA